MIHPANETSPRPVSPVPLKVIAPDPAAVQTPVDADGTYMDRFLAAAMLNVYGFRGRMARRVRADVAFAGLLILIQACVDLLAWFLGLRLVFIPGFGVVIGVPLALLFATLFASTIAIFERSVLVADTGLRGLLRNPAIWFRMGFVLLASLVTAVPLELFLFHDDIQGVIDRDRAAQVARAQDILRANADALLQGLDAKLDKDLTRLQAQYAEQRTYKAPTITSITPRLEALDKQIESVTAAMQLEDEGKRSGQAGRGRRYRSLHGQWETLNAQRALLHTDHQAELATLRQEARASADAAESAYREAVSTLRSAHDKEREALLHERGAIETLTERALASRARVDLDIPDGFSARVRILHTLAQHEATVEWGIWALRLVMVLFGLLVLIQKATFSIETKAYFSATAHAAQGDLRLRKLFGGLIKLHDISPTERRTMQAVVDDRVTQ